MARTLVLVVAMLSIYGPARADFLTGKDLLDYCTNTSTFANCSSYISGVWDFAVIVQMHFNVRGTGCINFPMDVNQRQLVDVVTRWLKAHPEGRDAGGGGGQVHGALSEAWPCPPWATRP